jgi:glycosyltransferase involved in cell wall biosynthesis
MKIVRVIARLNVGGPAKHVVWLTSGLRGTDCESLLVAGTVPDGEEDMSYFAAEHSVEPFLIAEMSREVSVKDPLTIWKLYRLFCRERPDIVHTHTAKAGTVGRVAGFIYRWFTPSTLIGRPRQCLFVHTYHGHIFHSYYGPLKTRLFLLVEKTLARLITNRIIVVSEQQRAEIQEYFGVGQPNQFVVIPLGLDLGGFDQWHNRRQTFRDELGIMDGDLLVGIVGRLTEIKNHELFLRAVASLKERLASKKFAPRIRFVVIGDGNLRNKLETQARSLDLVEDVIFAGNRRDPENFYPALDIVSLTSFNEGTPLTLIEAMANARPVVATAVGGVVDLLGEVVDKDQVDRYSVCQRGISVPSGDADAFAAGLQRLIEDANLRKDLGECGLSYVTGNHSKERLLNDMRALYDELLQRRFLPTKTRTSQQRLETRI